MSSDNSDLWAVRLGDKGGCSTWDSAFSKWVIIIRIEWNSSPLVSSTTILRGGALVRLLSIFLSPPPSWAWLPQTEDRKRYRLTHVCRVCRKNTIITLEILSSQRRKNVKWLTENGLQRSSKGIMVAPLHTLARDSCLELVKRNKCYEGLNK